VKIRETIGLVILVIVIAAAGWWMNARTPTTGNQFATNQIPNGHDQEPGSLPTSSAALLRELADSGVDPRILDTLSRMQQQLDHQAEEQRRLEAEIASLSASEVSIAAAGEEPSASNVPNRRIRGTATLESLIDAGFPAYRAEEIVQMADRLAMERLDLQYRAQREGWLRTTEYREALSEMGNMKDKLIEDFGDSAYDRYLYASGRPNRLVVRDVYSDSPAASASLQPGDRVVEMDGERVYGEQDLRRIATRGSDGQIVPVTIERGDSRFEVYVPRGPLGIRTTRQSVPPVDG
jgi:hypothetical protein